MRDADLIERLGTELGLPPPSPDGAGRHGLCLDGLTLVFQPDADDGFTLECPLGQVHPDDEALQEMLLESNLFADGVGGCVLGMNEAGQVCLVRRFRPGEAGFPRFRAALERFANLADYWSRGLSGGVPPHFQP